MTTKSVNIRPGVGMLGLFPAMNYKAWYALAELVDNAIDSYLRSRKQLVKLHGPGFLLRIVIEVESNDGGFIRVWDNAGGIEAHNYGRAFVTAEPPADSAGLSQFGIGMKSASCWFAREWRVRTTALSEPVERTIEFDVPEIIKRGIETVTPTTALAKPDDHFTEVRLWNLHKPPQTQTVGKMRRHLAGMYRKFLRSGEVEILFNDEPLKFDDPKVLVAPYFADTEGKQRHWLKDITFTLSTGERVSGFVGIRDKGSTKEAGLSLYRHRRLIVGSGEDTYRPSQIFGQSNSFAAQRVFGELDLDDFAVSHTKDGFIWDESEQEFVTLLRKEIDRAPLPVLKQADGYRSRQASPDLTAAASKAAASAAAVLPGAEETIERQASAKAAAPLAVSTYGTTHVASSKELVLSIKHQTWRVTIDTTNDPSATEWLKVKERPHAAGGREVGILLSVSHPFTQRFGGTTAQELEGLVRLACGIAVAEITARESGATMAGLIRKNLNELLGGALAKQ